MTTGAQFRLLIVDDTEAFRAALEQDAKSCGRFASVTTASDGQEALERIQAAVKAGATDTLPDIILADFYMPNLNGVELMHALRQNPATARILRVIVSACESPAERAAAREAGARAFFLKPGTPTGMRGLLEAVFWLAESAGVLSRPRKLEKAG